jgi:hypothetical protein
MDCFKQPPSSVVVLWIDRAQVEDDAIGHDAGDDGRIQAPQPCF